VLRQSGSGWTFESSFFCYALGGKHAEQHVLCIKKPEPKENAAPFWLVTWCKPLGKTSKSLIENKTKVPNHSRISSICFQCIRRRKLCVMFNFEVNTLKKAFSESPSKHGGITFYSVGHMSIQRSYFSVLTSFWTWNAKLSSFNNQQELTVQMQIKFTKRRSTPQRNSSKSWDNSHAQMKTFFKNQKSTPQATSWTNPITSSPKLTTTL
jgi:hypothetical protein